MPQTAEHTTTAPAPKGNSKDVIKEIFSGLAGWNPDEDSMALAKWSLEAVTHLTEYEDEKANRIFTAIAFLSALVGGLFAVVLNSFPLSARVRLLSRNDHLDAGLLFGMYLLFGLYFLLISVGAFATLWGIRPRFKIPRSWKPSGSNPQSMIFTPKIYEVEPRDWARAFASKSTSELQAVYARNCVLEAYLIAQKVRDKLAWLKPGTWVFLASTFVLFWLIIVAAVVAIRWQ